MRYFFILIAFLFGSIPFGYIIAKLFKGIDIREHGSGNPGATNVFRVVGPVAGVTAFIFDCLKGFLPVILTSHFFPETGSVYLIFVGLASISGHLYTPFLGFKGGKGVATGTGVYLALMPGLTLIGALVFIVTFALSRYVSLSSIIGGLSVAVIAWAIKMPFSISVFATLTEILIIYTHRANIQRLLNGTENRFKSGKQ